MKPTPLIINLKVKISMWDALKLGIAGLFGAIKKNLKPNSVEATINGKKNNNIGNPYMPSDCDKCPVSWKCGAEHYGDFICYGVLWRHFGLDNSGVLNE